MSLICEESYYVRTIHHAPGVSGVSEATDKRPRTIEAYSSDQHHFTA